MDSIGSFPAPFQIVIARLERTPSLVEAYARLTAMLDKTDFNRIGELSLDDWTFHMSIAYCSELPNDDWEGARTSLERELVEQPVDEALRSSSSGTRAVRSTARSLPSHGPKLQAVLQLPSCNSFVLRPTDGRRSTNGWSQDVLLVGVAR